MHNQIVAKLANLEEGKAVLYVGNMAIPVKITQVNTNSSNRSHPEIDIECEVEFANSYDIASLYPRQMIAYHKAEKAEKPANDFRIENVIFNDPATIVFWKDGTKFDQK